MLEHVQGVGPRRLVKIDKGVNEVEGVVSCRLNDSMCLLEKVGGSGVLHV